MINILFFFLIIINFQVFKNCFATLTRGNFISRRYSYRIRRIDNRALIIIKRSP